VGRGTFVAEACRHRCGCNAWPNACPRQALSISWRLAW
jgi:hypothetical protein